MSLAVLLVCRAAGAQSAQVEPSVPVTLQAPVVADGLQFGLGLVDRTFPLAGQLNLTTPVQVGYHWDRLSVLLGFYLAYGGVGSSSNPANGAAYSSFNGISGFQLAPAVRYYFRDLRPGKLAPYLQAEFDWVFYFTHHSQEPESTAPPSQASTTPIILGAALSAGTEYLFSENFGLSADVTLRYLHAAVKTSYPDSSSYTTSADILAVGGTAGVVVHF